MNQVGRVIDQDPDRLVDMELPFIEGDATEAHGLSPAAEKLIEQQRELQLWADRVGILCSGSFRSAIRAITITRHDTARVARELMSEGLLSVADRHHKSEPDAFEYLMLRAANLSAFYVSDEYGILASLVDGASSAGASSNAVNGDPPQ